MSENRIEAAAKSIENDDPRITSGDAYDLASNALDAADNVSQVTLGLYWNRLAAELHVTGQLLPFGGTRTLDGDIYTAEARDSLFGTTRYLVTAMSLRSAGYSLVEPSDV